MIRTLMLVVLLAQADPTSAWRAAQNLESSGQPAAAAAAYQDFLEKWPNHRLSRSVRARLASIERAGGSAEAFAQFQRVRREYAALGYDKAVEEVSAILVGNPDAPFADELVLWLGDRYRERGNRERAYETYAQLIADYPDSRLLFYAYAHRGGIEKARGDYDDAVSSFEAAGQINVPGAVDIANNEIVIVRAHARRYRLYTIIVPLLLVILSGFLATIRWRDVRGQHLRSLVVEALIAGPVIAVLWFLSTPETRWTIVTLTAAAVAVLALVVLWAETTHPAKWKPWVGLSGTLGAMVGVTYVTLYHFDQLIALGL